MSVLVLTPRGLRFGQRLFPCTIGRNGRTSAKCEGDSATPRGVHRISGLLYRPDRLPRPAPWAVAIEPRAIWSDDPADPNYNHMLKCPHPYRHESLRRSDPLYDLVLLTDWNWPDARPGHGSAIFLHQMRRKGYPTEGCIALSRTHLHWLAPRTPPGTRLIVG